MHYSQVDGDSVVFCILLCSVGEKTDGCSHRFEILVKDDEFGEAAVNRKLMKYVLYRVCHQ
jgi:hypothetical protein